MDNIPSILMVSWNRREYFERTVKHVLSDSSDFRLHFWDNGSKDGVSDIISDLRDERIVSKHFNPENVGQFKPWHWFMENCSTGIAGKLDDDILGEMGWMTRFSEMLADEPRLGLLAAWVYLSSEWDESVGSHKIRKIGKHQIFQNLWVPGCIFLGRIDVLRRHTSHDPKRLGVPIDHAAILRAGLISGCPLPMSFAENLDDPRSPFCRMNRPGGWDEFAAYTARMRNFSGPEEYGQWIAADARNVLEVSIADQKRMFDPSLTDRVKAKIQRGFKKIIK